MYRIYHKNALGKLEFVASFASPEALFWILPLVLDDRRYKIKKNRLVVGLDELLDLIHRKKDYICGCMPESHVKRLLRYT